MEIKNILASILVKKIPEYLVYSYQEIKSILNKCSSITELIDLSEIKKGYWAQIELNPLYECVDSKSGSLQIVCDFFISDGEFTLSSTILFPLTGIADSDDYIFDASGSKLPEQYCSIKSLS